MTHPLDLILDAMPPLGATLEYGVVVSVDAGAADLTVRWRGADIPNVRYVGAVPSASDKVWMIRQAKHMIVLSPAVAAGGGGRAVPAGSEHTVSETAPTAPDTGHVWVNPSDDTAVV